MLDFTVNEEELRKALAKVELAKKNGFTHSVAVFGITEAGRNIEAVKAEHQGMILKAHPTDPKLNWGRNDHPEWYRCVNGEVKDIEECKECRGKGKIEQDTSHILGSGWEGDMHGVGFPPIQCPSCLGSGEKNG